MEKFRAVKDKLDMKKDSSKHPPDTTISTTQEHHTTTTATTTTTTQHFQKTTPPSSSDENTVKTRVLIISDTHSTHLDRIPAHSPFRLPLPQADVLIHCGDLTITGKLPEYNRTLDLLAQISAPVKLVIAGNHDLSLDRTYMLAHTDTLSNEDKASVENLHAQALHLWTSPEGRAVREGVTFLAEEGVHSISLRNGARLNLWASAYTPEFYDWAFPYPREEDRFNPAEASLEGARNVTSRPVPSFSESDDDGAGTEGGGGGGGGGIEANGSRIDVLLTHGPPWGRLDLASSGDNAGCVHLLRAVMRAKPLLHCFGHIHEGWGAERVTWSKEDQSRLALGKYGTQDWQNGIWEKGIEAIEDVDVDLDDVADRHAACLDLSSRGGARPLVRGRETVFVNAAIMNRRYCPLNAAWLVDVDLTRDEGDVKLLNK